jgi:large subunit ribosomal protein L30
MYAVIRLKGLTGLRKDVEDTFSMLRLNRKMHCIVLKESDNVKGMLQKVRNWSTYGEIDDKVLKLLIEKRGRKPGDKRLNKEEAEEIFKKIKETGKMSNEIKPVFRLTPPSKGFKKSIKQHYPKGELGYRGEKINELLKRMI